MAAAAVADEFEGGSSTSPPPSARTRPSSTRELTLAVTGSDDEAALASLDSRILVVLDNLESIANGGRLVHDLVERTSCLTVLSTSRLPLRLRAEHEIPVPPLEVPPEGASAEEIAAAPAVEMFVDRAARRRAGVPAAGPCRRRRRPVPLPRRSSPRHRAGGGERAAAHAGPDQVRAGGGSRASHGPHQRPSGTTADPCPPRSSGATTGSTLLPARSRTDSPSSSAGSPWKPSRRCATTCPTCLAALAQIVEARLIRLADSRVEVRFVVLGTVRAYARTRLSTRTTSRRARSRWPTIMLRERAPGRVSSTGLRAPPWSGGTTTPPLIWTPCSTGRLPRAAPTSPSSWRRRSRTSGSRRGASPTDCAAPSGSSSPDGLSYVHQAELHLTAGKLAYHLTNWDLAARELRAVLALPDVDPTTATATRCYLGGALVVTGSVDEGATLASAALEEAERLGSLPGGRDRAVRAGHRPSHGGRCGGRAIVLRAPARGRLRAR